MYCVVMGRPESEFWHGSFAKITKFIDMYGDLKQIESTGNNFNSKYFNEEIPADVKEIKSMHEIEGWY